MTVAAFDTLKAAEALAEAGIEELHARAIAHTMRDAVTEGVATRTGLATLETRLTVRFVGIAIGIVIANGAATVAAVVALVKLLP